MGGRVILLAMRVALAIVFGQAGVLKIWDFGHARFATPDFALAIQQYEILPLPDLVLLLAVYLPWVEIAAALGLLIPRFRLGALAAILGMTTVFTIALASAWTRGLEIECHCFGKAGEPASYPALLARDAAILAAAAVLLVLEWRRSAAAGFDSAPRPAYNGAS